MKPPTPLLEVVSGAADADPEIEGLLHAVRESADPLPENRERVSRALGAALPVSLAGLGPSALSGSGTPLALGTLPAGAESAGAAPPRPGTSAASAALRAGGLIVGGLLLGGLGFWLGHDLGYSKGMAQALREQLGHVAARELAPVATVAASGAPDPTVALARAPAALPATEPHGAPARSRPTPPRKDAPVADIDRPRTGVSPDANGVAPTLSFRQALEQLRRAQQQLRSGQATMSLLVLSELDRVAGELLQEEREATRVLALCAVGQDEDARLAAQRLEQRSPGSIYAMRLSKSCAGAAPGPDDTSPPAPASSEDGLLGSENDE